MGWMQYDNAKHWKMVGTREVVDRRKELDDQFTWTRAEDETLPGGGVARAGRSEVLKSAMVGSVYYAAVRTEIRGKPAVTWAAVCRTRGADRTVGGVWGCKAMDETVGPDFHDCPAAILALLSPTEDAVANEWRRMCRERLAEKARVRREGAKSHSVPEGIEVEEGRGSWTFRSAAYLEQCHYRYAGVRYSKRRFTTFRAALEEFLHAYGTKAQKDEYAAA